MSETTFQPLTERDFRVSPSTPESADFNLFEDEPAFEKNPLYSESQPTVDYATVRRVETYTPEAEKGPEERIIRWHETLSTTELAKDVADVTNTVYGVRQATLPPEARRDYYDLAA